MVLGLVGGFFGETAWGMFFEMVKIMFQGQILKRFRRLVRGMVQAMIRGLIRKMTL